MTPLAALLERQIAAQGPMSLADYMAACLTHPEHGYYTTRDPLGQAGDFTTAPEISQMFGEMLGLCLAQVVQDQGLAAPMLVELGPGRGTLMADVARVLTRLTGRVASVHFVEVSPRLRVEQARRVPEAQWHDTLGSVPEAPILLLANEFFDALPIRQFRRSGAGWAEVQVGPGLRPALAPPVPLAALAHRLEDTREGETVELCPSAPAIMAEIARRVAASGGAALVLDYGGWHSRGDTFQAVRAHAPESPFANPGRADLTAHVDFEPLSRAARDHGAAVSGLTGQGALLSRLGIGARAEVLAQRLSGGALESHLAALRRLTHADAMGSLFKALAVTPLGAPPALGFDPGPTPR